MILTMPGAIPAGLGANARGHHMMLARHKKSWRSDWEVLMLAEQAGTFERVEITVKAYFCRSLARTPRARFARYQTQRPKDADNLQSCMKSAIDGLIDAGLVVDDDANHVSIGAPEMHEVETFAEERVELHIEELVAS